jgi:hypothetical protein
MDGAKITFPAYALAGAIGLIVSDEVATLTAERDRLEKQLHLEREANAALRAGLKPFAEYAEALGAPFTGDERIHVLNCEPMQAGRKSPTVGHCRRAAELLAPATGGGA